MKKLKTKIPKRDRAHLNAAKLIMRNLKKDYGKCGTLSIGCASCEAWILRAYLVNYVLDLEWKYK